MSELKNTNTINYVYNTSKNKSKKFCFVLFCELYYRQINQPTKIVTYKAVIAPACFSLA